MAASVALTATPRGSYRGYKVNWRGGGIVLQCTLLVEPTCLF
jgi:hypothetical protein